MLCAVLNHLFGELEVHVITNSIRRLFLHLVHGTNDLGLDWALSRKSLSNHFRLETNSGLCQQRRVNAASTRPRLCSLFILHPQHFQTLNERVHPVFARVDVSVHQPNQIRRKLLQSTVIHVFRKIGIKSTLFAFIGHEINHNTIDANGHFLWINNLNFNALAVIFAIHWS